jgi:lipopolysaccharide assembly outer membrane protein LptD (OstA)
MKARSPWEWRRSLAILASLLLLILRIPAHQTAGPQPTDAGAQKTASPPPEVRIVARTKEIVNGRIYASGDVEIHYGDIRLFADRVEYTPDTGDLMAEGNVVIQDREEVTRGERVFLNLQTGMGRIEKASGLMQPSLLFAAKMVERKSLDFFSLSRAWVTSCTQPVPRWNFSFSRGNLKKDDYIEMWNAVFSIKKIPVFYLPYLRYPLQDRATGFLMPILGYSAAKGFLYSQSFYWAIARNMDATAGLDVYPTLGLGAGLEYRYMFPAGTGGQVNLYYFTFKQDALGPTPSPSFVIRLKHTQALPLGFTLAASVDYETSFSFLQEFDNDFRQASIANRSAQVFLSRSWSLFNLSIRVSRIETYFAQIGDSIISTSLPQVNFNVFKFKLFSPLYFSLTGGFNNWQYGWQSEYKAGTERRSSNLSLSPTLSLPFSAIPWLTVNTSVTGNLVYYGQTLNPATSAIVDKPLFTRDVDVRLEITGPVLSRVFYGQDGEPRLKNIIEPYFNYTYESPVNDSDRIVTPYGFYRYHQVSYGLTSRFLLKKVDRPVEVLSFALGQTYYFSPATGPLSQYLVNGKPPRFSEINSTLRYYPSETFSLDAAVSFNPYYRNLSNLRLTVTAGSRTEGQFLSLNWFKSMNSWVPGVDPSLQALYNRHQISATGGLRLPGIALHLVGDVEYNLLEKKLLYTAGQIVYHYQCLDFLIEARVYYYLLQPETEFRFTVSLGNIGKTTDLLGGLGGFGGLGRPGS